jgi:succinoglycan biosynthesis transport protein ExoP
MAFFAFPAIFGRAARGPTDEGEDGEVQFDERDSESSLSAYLQVLRRWSWMIAICAVVAPIVAVLVTARKPVVHQASAQVLIRLESLAFALQHVNDPTAYDAVRTMDTEAQLARTPDVARRALQAAGIRQYPSYLLGSSTVTEQPNSDILTFTVTKPSGSRAMTLVNAYAGQFAAYRNQLESASIRKSITSIRHELDVLAAQGAAGSAQYQSLAAAAAQLQTMRLLQTARAVVVRQATGASTIRSSPTRAGVLGALLGLVLGVGVAFLAESLDRRVRSEDRIRRVLGLPLLGRVERPSQRLRQAHRLAMLDTKDDPQAHAFRIIAMNLKLARLKTPAKKIMVTSALPAEGKTTTAANLAVALAQNGESVILVDLDLRSPSAHTAFRIGPTPGVTDVVVGRSKIDEVTAEIDIEQRDELRLLRLNTRLQTGSLHIVPAGSYSSNMSEAVPLEAIGELLAALEKRADVVIIDAPPLLLSGSALGFTGLADGILVVAQLKVLRTNALHDLKRTLDSVPATQLGFVVAGASPAGGYGTANTYGMPPTWHPPKEERDATEPAAVAETPQAVRELR